MTNQNKIQDMVNNLVKMLSESNLSLRKKDYAINIIQTIIADYNLLKQDNIRMRSKRYHVTDFQDYTDKMTGIVNLLCGEYGLDFFKPESYGWILKHKSELKELTFARIKKLAGFYDIFVMLEKKEPESVEQLKSFILENELA